MLNFIDLRIVAAAQLIMAAGTIHFWITWFRKEHHEPWLPAGYVEHERVFVYPDVVMSALMITSAVLLLMGNPLGEKLALVCGGMVLFLTIIDIAYFAQHRLFAKERGGKENLGLVIPMIMMSLLLIVRFIW
ncbi:MAG: hypothetical protein FJ152_08045 [Firmicutes bacterium]|nr:hypothetical protein [Bacillota bacterium]